jgi:predicted TPR repeat methyltransferase
VTSTLARCKPLAKAQNTQPNAVMADKPNLESAYALETPDDSRKLYAAWAATYDTQFADENHYILHEQVARHFALMGGFGPVLDVGAGTGLCGEALNARGIEPVDGTDISAQMLEVARTKGCYRTLFTGNILTGLDVTPGIYQGAVSAGTFTHGHVGPEGINTMLDAVRPQGWVVFSVNATHYQAAGFADKMAQLKPFISDYSATEARIYGPKATAPYADDMAILIAFRKA